MRLALAAGAVLAGLAAWWGRSRVIFNMPRLAGLLDRAYRRLRRLRCDRCGCQLDAHHRLGRRPCIICGCPGFELIVSKGEI